VGLRDWCAREASDRCHYVPAITGNGPRGLDQKRHCRCVIALQISARITHCGRTKQHATYSTCVHSSLAMKAPITQGRGPAPWDLWKKFAKSKCLLEKRARREQGVRARLGTQDKEKIPRDQHPATTGKIGRKKKLHATRAQEQLATDTGDRRLDGRAHASPCWLPAIPSRPPQSRGRR
jgi:hypothetical protein